jgi:prepilin-type processing-associated H-X9-DG protein
LEVQQRNGLSHTILIGEKSLSVNHYEDGKGAGDTLTMYVGDSDDIRRDATLLPVSDARASSGFGSAHGNGCNLAMADGAVRFVAGN